MVGFQSLSKRGVASSCCVELKPEEIRSHLKTIAVDRDRVSLAEVLIEGSFALSESFCNFKGRCICHR